MPSPLDRILDANLNRAREGLRVAEDIARLVLGRARLQAVCKTIRHGITAVEKLLPGPGLLRSRAADTDPGARGQGAWEKKQENLTDVLRANLRRAQEALRVLEEISRLISLPASRRFKRLRFQTYTLEADFGRQPGAGRGPSHGRSPLRGRSR